MGFLGKLFGKADNSPTAESERSSNPDPNFFRIDGQIQLYAVRGGGKPSVEELNQMVGKANLGQRAAQDMNGQMMNCQMHSFEELQTRHRSSGFGERDATSTVVETVAVHTAMRLKQGGLNMNKRTMTLENGKRVEVLVLWSGALSSGHGGWLVTLAEV